MWWDHDLGWAGWITMTLGMAGFWVLVALLAFAILRSRRDPGANEPDPQQILERRLARGEIDVKDYRERLAALDRTAR